MASTVIGFFRDYPKAILVLDELVASSYDQDLIKLAYLPPDHSSSQVDFDNTLEQAPVIEFKDATFGADIAEEDAVYYSECLEKGQALLTVHIPSDASQERDWEDRTARTIEDFLADGGAFDHEIRKVYSNRGNLTTYPQTRYLDPVGPNKLNKDRIYESRSPLNGEVSNVIGVTDNTNYLEELNTLAGRSVLTARQVLALREK